MILFRGLICSLERGGPERRLGISSAENAALQQDMATLRSLGMGLRGKMSPGKMTPKAAGQKATDSTATPARLHPPQPTASKLRLRRIFTRSEEERIRDPLQLASK